VWGCVGGWVWLVWVGVCGGGGGWGVGVGGVGGLVFVGLRQKLCDAEQCAARKTAYYSEKDR